MAEGKDESFKSSIDASPSNVVLDEETTPVDNNEKENGPSQPSASPIVRQRIRLFDKAWKKWAWGIGGLVLFILAVSLLATSFKKVKSTEYGVLYTPYSKKLDDAARTGGLHSGPPGFKFIKFPSTFITVDLPDDICISQDGLRVGFAVTFQYQMPAEWLLPAVVKYRNFEKWAQIVEAAGNSAVHHSCSEFQISNFQNKRGSIQLAMENNLRIKLEGTNKDGSDGVYARAISLQLRNVDLPEEYSSAIREKQAAAEDIVLAQNQRTQETTKAQTTLLSAQEEARIINSTAYNDAEIILTEAEIKAEEITFSFETEASVIVMVKTYLKLSTEGVLGYMGNRLLAGAKSLKVATEEPARFSRKDAF